MRCLAFPSVVGWHGLERQPVTSAPHDTIQRGHTSVLLRCPLAPRTHRRRLRALRRPASDVRPVVLRAIAVRVPTLAAAAAAGRAVAVRAHPVHAEGAEPCAAVAQLKDTVALASGILPARSCTRADCRRNNIWLRVTPQHSALPEWPFCRRQPGLRPVQGPLSFRSAVSPPAGGIGYWQYPIVGCLLEAMARTCGSLRPVPSTAANACSLADFVNSIV